MSGVNEELSAAVVVYTRRGHSKAPRGDSGAIIDAFGPDRGPVLVVEVAELFREANLIPVDWSTMDLNQATDHMIAIMTARHPELTAEALKAIDWKYSFDWR